jgi:hypothetical protein
MGYEARKALRAFRRDVAVNGMHLAMARAKCETTLKEIAERHGRTVDQVKARTKGGTE